MTHSKIIALSLVSSLFAAGCVISSDPNGSLFDDAGTSHGGSSSGGSGGTTGQLDAASSADSGTMMSTDAGMTDTDGGNNFICVAPSDSTCSDCVANTCLPEWCACEADEACGTEAGELSCMLQCVQDKSDMVVPVDQAFSECASLCAYDGILLASATNDLLLCMRAPVPDPAFADAGLGDAGTPEVAVCGYSCFGYYDPAVE